MRLCLQHLKACLDQDPVLIGHRHEVADRPYGHKVQKPLIVLVEHGRCCPDICAEKSDQGVQLASDLCIECKAASLAEGEKRSSLDRGKDLLELIPQPCHVDVSLGKSLLELHHLLILVQDIDRES